ncbi:hypothetical protein CAPTEDRAFT_169445 [Capitella teleta]|uniref:PPM-type phosphatase domain-containing protein n=1 Tax=Capitella teleta TaxID=283909 RepID=R7TE08_CAPTE|nr:hypothetical protein CAPTEDRAFT_169445 [Capitella teleta]|eukprot:ELT91993.1 hypothetical protein CAPTEDRAFT_169445 [Capitella teleta]
MQCPFSDNPGFSRLSSHVAERRGERADMQDAHVIIEDFSSFVSHLHSSVGRISYYAVFDGHAGDRASKFAAENVHKKIASGFPKGELNRVEADMKKCLVDAYKKSDEEFLKLATQNKPVWKDGTTAISVLVINNTLYIANLGDSKAILCRYNPDSQKHTALPLSKCHNPTDYEERMRIQKAGGNVREGRVMGVLEVSRSIGDGPYKKLGISAIPDVKRCQLTDEDRYIVIACDGLWKSFSNDEAIKEINCIIEAKESQVESESSVWDAASNHLASEAVRKLSADNVTVLIIKIS